MIKTWNQIKDWSNGQWPDEQCMQEEIAQLRQHHIEVSMQAVAALAELRMINELLDSIKMPKAPDTIQRVEIVVQYLRTAATTIQSGIRTLGGLQV